MNRSNPRFILDATCLVGGRSDPDPQTATAGNSRSTASSHRPSAEIVSCRRHKARVGLAFGSACQDLI